MGSPPSLQPHGGQRASLWCGPCWSWVVSVPVPTSLHLLSASPVDAGMDFHKELHRIETKEGLRGRKLQKALESFAWNITVLKVRGKGCTDTPALPCPALPRHPPASSLTHLPDISSLQGQADLLKHAKAEALDNLWQIHNAGQSCGIGRNGSASPEPSRLQAPLEPIPETDGGGDTASC